MSKNHYIVEVCTLDAAGKECHKYVGRLLGLIDDKEFAILLRSKDSMRRCVSVETMPLREIADNFDSLEGLRLVVAPRQIDDKEVQKKLFVSRRLKVISCTDVSVDTLYMTDEDYGGLTIQEFELGNYVWGVKDGS